MILTVPIEASFPGVTRGAGANNVQVQTIDSILQYQQDENTEGL